MRPPAPRFKISAILRSALGTIMSHPVILFPFSIVAFVQLLLLEIIYFAPREPLRRFFEPLILRFDGEVFLHYPFNFFMMTRWFQKVQIPVYLFLSTYIIGVAIAVIRDINGDRKVCIGKLFRETLSSYVHLFIMGLLSVGLLAGFNYGYGFLVRRALQISSTSGIFFIIKQTVVLGMPYFNLLFAVLVTALFAFVLPVIVIEKKKIFGAIMQNFRLLGGSFFCLAGIVLIPSLLYLPVILLRGSKQLFGDVLPPEMWGVLLVVSVFVLLLIDALQYTAITTLYLLKKEIK